MSLHNFMTFSNKIINLNSICKNDILLKDIAHALSMTCRFNGHIKDFYSVAQHSIMVSVYLKQKNYDSKIQLYGLLHDAAEAYINDVVTPVKYLLNDYKNFENKLQNIIYEAFDLYEVTEETLNIVKKADSYVTSLEIAKFFSGCKDKDEYELYISKIKTFSKVETDFCNRALSLMKD